MSAWDGMSAREGRDIARYIGHDEYGRPERFDTNDPVDLDDLEDLRRETRAAFRRKTNPEVLRRWFEADLALSGFTLDEALATVKRGTISAANRPRYDALARGVAHLRQRGATLESIGEAIGRGPQTVANLETRAGGRKNAEEVEREKQPEPCRRHSTFEPDCPACLRNAPERAPKYSGPEILRGQLVGGSQADD